MGFPIWAKHLADFLDYGLLPMWAKRHVGALYFMYKLSQYNDLFSKVCLKKLSWFFKVRMR